MGEEIQGIFHPVFLYKIDCISTKRKSLSISVFDPKINQHSAVASGKMWKALTFEGTLHLSAQRRALRGVGVFCHSLTEKNLAFCLLNAVNMWIQHLCPDKWQNKLKEQFRVSGGLNVSFGAAAVWSRSCSVDVVLFSACGGKVVGILPCRGRGAALPAGAAEHGASH